MITGLDQHLAHPVGRGELDVHAILRAGFEGFADEIRLDGKLPVRAVDQDREFNASWPAEVQQGVERGAGCATAAQHIVDENDALPGNVERDLRRMNLGCQAAVEVVAVHGHIQLTDRDFTLPARSEPSGQLKRQVNAPGLNPNQHHIRAPVRVPCSNPGRDALHGAVHGSPAQQQPAR